MVGAKISPPDSNIELELISSKNVSKSFRLDLPEANCQIAKCTMISTKSCQVRLLVLISDLSIVDLTMCR